MFPGLFFVFLYSNVYQGVHLFTQVVLKFPDRGNEGIEITVKSNGTIRLIYDATLIDSKGEVKEPRKFFQNNWVNKDLSGVEYGYLECENFAKDFVKM